MGYAAKHYKIDSAKLVKELKKRGLAYADVSREMGYNSAFISNAIARGTINIPAAKMLNTLYSIDIKSIMPDDAIKAEADAVTNTVKDVVDYEKLYEVIYTAVYNAVKKAWAE